MIAPLNDFLTYEKFETGQGVWYFTYNKQSLKIGHYIPDSDIKYGIIARTTPYSRYIKKINKDHSLSKSNIVIYDKCISDNYEEIKNYYNKLIQDEIERMDSRKIELGRMVL